MRIAIIGAGISGIAAAQSLRKTGHDVQVFEKSKQIGGVWNLGYPQVRLQNTRDHYRLMDVPWSSRPDRHPTSAQIQKHLHEAIDKLDLTVNLGHEVTRLEETQAGWRLHYRDGETAGQQEFDFVIPSIGQYSDDKPLPEFPGQASFRGSVITEREIRDLSVFAGKKVLVVGFGKSALDMATFAVEQASEVNHIFRTPRWMIPFNILGIHYSRLLFCRLGTVLMPSWVQPNAFEGFIHRRLGFLVRGNWAVVKSIAKVQKYVMGLGRSDTVKRRLALLTPDHDLVGDFRSAAAMQPQMYTRYVAQERPFPSGELASFTETGVVQGWSCHRPDLVCAVWVPARRYFLHAEEYRCLLESEPDGSRIPNAICTPHTPHGLRGLQSRFHARASRGGGYVMAVCGPCRRPGATQR